MLNSLYARKRKELAEAKRLEGAKPVKDAVEDRSVDDLLSFIEGGGGGDNGGGGGGGSKKGGGGGGQGGGGGGGSERRRKKKERERAKKRERLAQQAKQEEEKKEAERAKLEAERAATQRRKALKQQAEGGGKGGGKGAKGKKKGGSAPAPAPAPAPEPERAPEQPDNATQAASRFELDISDDDPSDEEMDPDLRAAQDREVEEFARRLNGSLDAFAGDSGSADLFAAFATNARPRAGGPGSSESAEAPPQRPAEVPAAVAAAAARIPEVESVRLDASVPSAPLAPPPHDFKQTLAATMRSSSPAAGGVLYQRVATAVWAPPPLFEASDGIPGVARAHCAVSYAVATLGMAGVSLTDVCSASFTGLGASHAQLTAHVSAPDEVTVILRAVPHPSSPPERLQVRANPMPHCRSALSVRLRVPQLPAGQLTVVATDHLGQLAAVVQPEPEPERPAQAEAAAEAEATTPKDAGPDGGQVKAGEANGYGTVAVDLAKEQETLKALRKQQMDRPPCAPSTLTSLPRRHPI